MLISWLGCPDDRHLGSGLMGAHFLLNKTANKAPKSLEWLNTGSAKFKGCRGLKGHNSHVDQERNNNNSANITFLSK